MNSIKDGLFLHEIILMVLGVLLFLVLLVGLVYYIFKREPIRKLWLFFPFPIVMIGYSSIQKISFEDGKVEIEKYTAQLENNPADSTAREELREILAIVESRNPDEVDNKLLIGEAYSALGENDKAQQYASDVLTKDSTHEGAKELKAFTETTEVLNQFSGTGSDPTVVMEASEETKNALKKNIDILESSDRQDVKTRLKIAEAYVALNDTVRAKSYIDDVLTKQPEYKDARNLFYRLTQPAKIQDSVDTKSN